MRRIATLLLATALLALVASPARAADDLLNAVLLKNEAARQAIRSYAFTLEIQSQQKDRNGPILKETGELKRRGADDVYCVARHVGANRDNGEVRELESRTVVNARYVAHWPMKGNPLAYRDDHASVAQMSERIRSRVERVTAMDFVPRCFGDSVRSFREAVSLHPDTKWDAVEAKDAAGQPVYHVRRFMPTMDDPAKPDCVWVLDPRKGHLVTSMTAHKADGRPWIERTFQVAEISPGLWFPTALEEKDYGGRDAASPDAVVRWQKASLANVAVNVDMPDAQFEIDALRLKQDHPDIVVLVKPLDGRAKPHVYDGDTLVPQSATRKRGAP